MYGNPDSIVKHPYTHSTDKKQPHIIGFRQKHRLLARSLAHSLRALWSNFTCFQRAKFIQFSHCRHQRRPHTSPLTPFLRDRVRYTVSISCIRSFLIKIGFTELWKLTRCNEAWADDMDQSFSALWRYLFHYISHALTHWTDICLEILETYTTLHWNMLLKTEKITFCHLQL